MKTVNDEYSILITRVLSGEADDTDHSHLETWLSLSAENHEIFEQYKAVWNIQCPDIRSANIDKPAAWDKINEQIIQQEKSSPKKQSFQRAIFATTSMAALILLFIGVFTLFKNNQSNVEFVHYTAADAFSNLQLPDGSMVSLKQTSTLNYAEDFKGDERNLLLSGEAYFEVAHDPEKPFIVQTNEAVIKVLGTSFNIRHNEVANSIEVAVVEGKVSLRYKQMPGNELILHAGDFGTLDLKTTLLNKYPIKDYNFMAWKTGVLEFDETELTEVLNVLENTYNLDVTSQKELAGLKLTARFSNESPEDIFKTIGILFNLQIEKEGQQVSIN